MSDTALENLVLTTMARGTTAELRFILENCDDREVALPIYRELRRIAYDMAKKYDFERSAARTRYDLIALDPEKRVVYA